MKKYELQKILITVPPNSQDCTKNNLRGNEKQVRLINNICLPDNNIQEDSDPDRK